MIRTAKKIIPLILGSLISQVHADELQDKHTPLHFNKIMVVIFENMSYAEIKKEPTFKRLVEYTGFQLDHNGKLLKLAKSGPSIDTTGNGYAFFSSYYNNHTGGKTPTRSSQPNYIALTSGSIHGIKDNENYDLDVDNLASELIDANVSWKVYAEDLPDPGSFSSSNITTKSSSKNSIPVFVRDPNKNEQENDEAEREYYKLFENTRSNQAVTNRCFTEHSYHSSNGYQRKHEPFISYVNIQNQFNYCKNIVNSSHLEQDLPNMPAVSFYIPNQINDGHNGTLSQRIVNANAFLSKLMGTNPKTGEPLADAANAPLQKFMASGGLVVITFDEPSVEGNPDRTIYTLLAGKMINTGIYPNRKGKNGPVCFPDISKQTEYTHDENGAYSPEQCNHYNLLKLIETNWNLRGLKPKDTSTGYKYALSLDNNVNQLWRP